MHLASRLSLVTCFAFAALSGCADAPSDSQSCHAVSAPVDDPDAMPPEILAYLGMHHMGHMHLDFHVARQWDILGPDTQDWATRQDITRSPLQEGVPTSGLEFLAMHRLMIGELMARFPDHAGLFAGWKTPPTDAKDPANLLPDGTPAFDANMVAAIDRIENGLSTFDSDDDFARFLQTKRRPTEADPHNRDRDPSAGLHNYLHQRWTSPDSPINVGDPALNLGNQVFWRIHGWIDARWTAWFDGLEIVHSQSGGTILRGFMPDQPALFGVLGKIRDLGLTLISVHREMEN